jgi:hypothetical protein
MASYAEYSRFVEKVKTFVEEMALPVTRPPHPCGFLIFLLLPPNKKPCFSNKSAGF